jgi:methionine synthase II (cobalamin-independent)
MTNSVHNFRFIPTGIGSVPFRDIDAACLKIVEDLPEIPFWPQFVKRSFLEDMNVQPSEALPFLKIRENERSLLVSEDNRESQLVTFYEHFLAEDIDHFAISREYAPGLYRLLELIARGDEHNRGYVKGQSVGPVTFAATVKDREGKSLFQDTELLEAMTKGISIKALWQVRKLSTSGRKPIIFLDEPYLSGFGSAFSPIERHQVIDLLGTVITYLREKSDTLIGVHCCGNTDWAMLLEAGPDIINFDAYEYMEHFLLYKDDIIRFLEQGGIIAWGIIPTSNSTEKESVEGLFAKLKEGLGRLHEWGVDPELLAQRSILTPACGMGTMPLEDAKRGLDLLSRLSQKCRGLP